VTEFIIQMRLVNPLSVQDLGPISCIVYTRPKKINQSEFLISRKRRK